MRLNNGTVDAAATRDRHRLATLIGEYASSSARRFGAQSNRRRWSGCSQRLTSQLLLTHDNTTTPPNSTLPPNITVPPNSISCPHVPRCMVILRRHRRQRGVSRASLAAALVVVVVKTLRLRPSRMRHSLCERPWSACVPACVRPSQLSGKRRCSRQQACTGTA